MRMKKAVLAVSMACAMVMGVLQGGVVQAKCLQPQMAAQNESVVSKASVNKDKYKNRIKKFVMPKQCRYLIDINGTQLALSRVKYDFALELFAPTSSYGVYGVGSDLWCYEIDAATGEDYAHSSVELDMSDVVSSSEDIFGLGFGDDVKSSFKYVRYNGPKMIDGKKYDEVLADSKMDGDQYIRCHIYVVPNTNRVYDLNFTVKDDGGTAKVDMRSISGRQVSPMFAGKQVRELSADQVETSLNSLLERMLGSFMGTLQELMDAE